MLPKEHSEKVRINIQLPADMRERLLQASYREGKKISVFVRESIEEKINRLERLVFEEQMKTAYQDLAEENLEISEEFKFADAENLPEEF
jgi:predicted DNA-binding protein